MASLCDDDIHLVRGEIEHSGVRIVMCGAVEAKKTSTDKGLFKNHVTQNPYAQILAIINWYIP